MLAKVLFDNGCGYDRIESMDVRVSNKINNNSPQESGVNTLTSSQICGGYFNKESEMTKKEMEEKIKTLEFKLKMEKTVSYDLAVDVVELKKKII